MNPNCPDNLKKLVPLSKVVNASIIDIYQDIGKTQQLHFHWAARGLKQLQKETLKSGRRNVLITVSPNTRTASLPLDFESELFVGYINKYGEKVPIPLQTNLTNSNSITEIECEDVCAVCNQDKSICNDLTVTECVELVVVNEGTYEKTTIKKLYPDGSYFLETTIPYWNIKDNVIAYVTTKEFIAKIDLKDCGCVETTTKNIETIRTCCYDAYCCHFSPCNNVCDNDCGGYKIFEGEVNLIQFDYKFRHKQIYLEYLGFIPKINGQLAVPEVAFETLVEWVKFKSIEGKSNISNPDKKWRWDMYTIARGNMRKVMGRLSLDDIIHAVSLTPKFDWTSPSWKSFCPPVSETLLINNDMVTNCAASPPCNSACPSPTLTPFTLAVKVPSTPISGKPVAGQTSYQNDALIGALNLEYIIVTNTIEIKQLSQFTFDSSTGIIDRAPNIWIVDDVLIIPYNKMV